MPKIEKDLLKVKGSDGQWHYVPAVGVEGGSTPTWDAVQNKPFESLGDGLSVENGVLSAKGGTGGSPNAVQYTEQTLTDEQKAQARKNIGAKATTEKSAYIIRVTRSYGYIHTTGMDFDGVYALIQSGKVVMLLVDNSATYYGVITTVTDKTIMFYNIRDMSQSGVGGRNKGITYFGFTWRKGDDSLTEWWGDIPSVEVDETLTKSGSAADAKAVGDALRNYVPAEEFRNILNGIGEAFNIKLDKNQGTTNAGKILGIGEDGNVVPQDKPTYTAEEVGALPNTTVIPTVPATLPNPHKLTFTGAVTGEYDGSTALTVDIPQGGDSLVIPEQRIALDNAMLVGPVTHVGTVLETNTDYKHTEKIKLNSHKSFQLTGKDASGVVKHIALRYVTAYDADGKVISAYSLQNVAEASASAGRVVQMDAAVDSVIVSIYKPEQYTDKTFILPSVVRDVASVLAEKITAPTTAAVGQIIKVKSVDTSGKPTEWEAADLPSGGSGAAWELLAEQTTTEVVKAISLTLAKSVKHVVAKIWCPATGAEAVNRYVTIKIGASNLFYYIPISIPDKSMTSQLTVSADSIGGGYWRLSYYANRGDKAFDLFGANNQNHSVAVGVVKATYTEANTLEIMVVETDTTQQFPAGTILKVWGN